MNKWYKAPWMKGILILAAILSVGGIFAGLYTALNVVPSDSLGQLFRSSEQDYFQTETFENQFHIASMAVLRNLRNDKNFETDGSFDDQKLVDIEQYSGHRIVDGKNESGFAYRLADLMEWGDRYSEDGISTAGPAVVCLKPDGTYYYYRMEEFEQLLRNRELLLEDIGSISGFLEDMKAGIYASGAGTVLTDMEGNVIYTDCWTFEDIWEEPFAPDGATSILDIVNQNLNWNGRLSEMYTMLEDTLASLPTDVADYQMQDDVYQAGNTNFAYILIDLEGEQIWTNQSGWNQFADYETYLNEIKNNKNKFCIIQEKLNNCDNNINGIDEMQWQHSIANAIGNSSMDQYIFAAAVDTELPIPDDFQLAAQEYEKSLVYMPYVSIGLVISALLFAVSVVWLTVISGNKGDDGKILLNFFDRIPTEISACGIVIVWLVILYFLVYVIGIAGGSSYYETSYGFLVKSQSDYEGVSVIFAGLSGIWSGMMFFTGYLSLLRRIKAKTLWLNSVLRKMCLFTKKIWDNRSITFRMLIIGGAVCFIHWLAMLISSYQITVFHVLAVITEIAAVVWLLQASISKDRIHKGVKEIAEGNLEYQISTKGLPGDYADIAEQINHIGDGLQKAVEKSMKDERLKTDLITNVSHDIKTPLTSIINYIDLLKREELEDPRIQNYLEILTQKSQRLKQLTEDVVEASKVSSGNITLEYMDLNLTEMILQAEGEFEEKFAEKKLQSVLNLPDGPAVVRADGRRLWRVLENLYNNVAKYAMPGSRVYADLSVEENEVVFSLKNISEQPLNISADELTERFIRGDISRSTEGSGLGLSIAKSLTILQGGKFQLYLDGDLFRATVAFPKVK